MNVRAASLTRVSTGEQAHADRHSLPMQQRMIEAYAAREGMTIVRVFEIPGESAFTPDLAKRPQFRAAIEAAERREFDVLLVYDLSRFARDQRVLHECLYRLRQANVRLIGVHNGIDYTSDDGRDWAGIEGVFAERSSREHGRRIRHAIRRRFEQGLPVGDIPFGYRPAGTDKPPTVVEEEAEAIRWGIEAFRRGVGYQAIAAEWNRRGLRPRSKRGIGAFGVSSVQSVLENRFYAGYISHHGEERRGAHEPIVSEVEWRRAQQRVRRQVHSAREWGALLQGLAECSHCHGPLWVKPAGERRKDGERRLYYWEPARVRGRECGAQGRMRPVARVDAEIERAVVSMATDSSWWEEALELAHDDGEAAAIDRRRSDLQAKRERAGMAGLEGWLAPDVVRAEIARIDRELATLPVDARRVFTAGEEFRDMASVWEIASPRRRNELCRILFDGVRLDPLGDTIEVRAAEEFRDLLDFRRDWVAERPKCGFTPARTRTPVRTSGLYDLRELVVA